MKKTLTIGMRGKIYGYSSSNTIHDGTVVEIVGVESSVGIRVRTLQNGEAYVWPTQFRPFKKPREWWILNATDSPRLARAYRALSQAEFARDLDGKVELIHVVEKRVKK